MADTNSAQFQEQESQLTELVCQGIITEDQKAIKIGSLKYGKSYNAEIHEEITQLDELLADNTITQEIYDKKKAECLQKMSSPTPPSPDTGVQVADTGVQGLESIVESTTKIATEIAESLEEISGDIKQAMENENIKQSMENENIKQSMENEKMAQLQELLESGIISQEIFDKKKIEVLGVTPQPTVEPEKSTISDSDNIKIQDIAIAIDVKLEAPPKKKYSSSRSGSGSRSSRSRSVSPIRKPVVDSPLLGLSPRISSDVYIESTVSLLKKEEVKPQSEPKKPQESVAPEPPKELDPALYPLELKEKIAQLEELLKDEVLPLADFERKKKQYIDAHTLGLDPVKLAKLAQLDELLKDGLISQEEYQKRRKEIEGLSEKEKAQKIFNYFNKDGSGKLSVKEFQALCFEMGEVFSSTEVSRAISEIDLDGDGLIDFEEFYQWWTNKAPGDKSENQKLRFLQMKLQSESYLRTIKGITEKIAPVSAVSGPSVGVDANITFGNFKRAVSSLKIRSFTDKGKAAELAQLCGSPSGIPVAYLVIDLKPEVDSDMIQGILELAKPFIKKATKDAVQIKHNTTHDGKSQIIFSLPASEEKAESVNAFDFWEHAKLELDFSFDQSPAHLTSEALGIQFQAKGSIPREILDNIRKLVFKSQPGVSRIFGLFAFGKVNLRLLPIDQLLSRLFKEDPKKAAPLPVIKGWHSVKELIAGTFYSFMKSEGKEFVSFVSSVFQVLNLIDKVGNLGVVVKDTTVTLTTHNFNIFDLIPTQEELGLKPSVPKQVIKEGLKLHTVEVFNPDASKEKIKPKTFLSSSSSSSSSSSDEVAKEEGRGRFTTDVSAILVPNFRHWTCPDSGSVMLLFKSESTIKISHIILRTPRYTTYPVKTAMFFISDEDPRIQKKEKKDKGYTSSDEAKQYVNKEKPIWPPIVRYPGSKLPFAAFEVPQDRFYVEYELPVPVSGKYIEAFFMDGWQKSDGLPGTPGPLREYNRKREKISIQYIAFVGPAEPWETKRDLAKTFDIVH